MELAATRPTMIGWSPVSATPWATPTLYLAFELGVAEWKLGLTCGVCQPPRFRTIPARALTALWTELATAKARFGLAPTAPVMSCYEAGRDGFWLHRALLAEGVANVVVDSASIEVNRRLRRAKSDRLDAGKLLGLLLRAAQGERRVWSVVHVPTPADEDRRQLHRELQQLTQERTRRRNRIKGLLATQGIALATLVDVPAELAALRTGDGAPVAPGLRARVEREWERLERVVQQREDLRRARRALLRTAPADDPTVRRVRALLALRAIGIESAWLYVLEFFGWRQFANGREVGALAGLTPTPFASGLSAHEQGISKAGNRRVRVMAIESAWMWLRLQPQSELAQWYRARFAGGNSRTRRIGIVAVARRLLVALWRYLETGEVPAGAIMKA
jgi:transposase